MSSSSITFRRINGHIVPIKAPSQRTSIARQAAIRSARSVTARAAGITAGTGFTGFGQVIKKGRGVTIKPHAGLKMLGHAAAVGSSVLSAATFFSKGKLAFWGGLIGSTALDVASSAANAASVSGPGHAKARIRAGLKGEVINQGLGWGTFAVGLLGFRRNRKKLAVAGLKAARFARKAVSFV
jgi:hypothetical protein